MNYILNNPYFIYPNGPLSEYNCLDNYNLEIIKLFEHIKFLIESINMIKNSDPQDNFVLIPFIIGSTMEQSIKKGFNEPNTYYQWQQLFPNYINNFIDRHKEYINSKIYIYITIVSPDSIFSDFEYSDPFFIINTGYPFTKISNRKYISEFDNIKINVDIFNCPLPTIETRIDIIKKYNDFIKSNPNNFSGSIKNYEQTNDDLIFISDFYNYFEVLLKLCDYRRINIIINSYATFKNLYGYENFKMFPKILDLSIKNNILATEWIYKDNSYSSQILSFFKIQPDKPISHIFKYIIYLDPNYTWFGLINNLIKLSPYDKLDRYQINWSLDLNIILEKIKKD